MWNEVKVIHRNKIIHSVKGQVKYAHLNLTAIGSSWRVLGKGIGLVGKKEEKTKITDEKWSFLAGVGGNIVYISYIYFIVNK